MSALGFVMETVFLWLGPFFPFFLIFWVIINVSLPGFIIPCGNFAETIRYRLRSWTLGMRLPFIVMGESAVDLNMADAADGHSFSLPVWNLGES